MAIRNIVKFGDEVLNKKCRPVKGRQSYAVCAALC